MQLETVQEEEEEGGIAANETTYQLDCKGSFSVPSSPRISKEEIDALKQAIVAGGATLDRAVEALAASRVTNVGLTLKECEQATEEVLARVLAVLPVKLEHLSLVSCEQLRSVPRLSALTQLQTLTVNGCDQLTSLPDLSGLTKLRKLEVGQCGCEFESLPDLSALTQLQMLRVVFLFLNKLPAGISALTQLQTLILINCCNYIHSCPDLSALTKLQTLNLHGGSKFTEIPGLSALTQLQTLDLNNCLQLESLPDLSGLTQLQTLDLTDCWALGERLVQGSFSLDLSALTRLQTLNVGSETPELYELASLPPALEALKTSVTGKERTYG